MSFTLFFVFCQRAASVLNKKERVAQSPNPLEIKINKTFIVIGNIL